MYIQYNCIWLHNEINNVETDAGPLNTGWLKPGFKTTLIFWKKYRDSRRRFATPTKNKNKTKNIVVPRVFSLARCSVLCERAAWRCHCRRSRLRRAKSCGGWGWGVEKRVGGRGRGVKVTGEFSYILFKYTNKLGRLRGITVSYSVQFGANHKTRQG